MTLRLNKSENISPVLGAIALLILTLAPAAAYAQQWELAVGNLGGGGYFKAYTSLSECRSDQDEGDTCIAGFQNCGPSGLMVFITMFVAESITDPLSGNEVRVFTMNGEDVGDPICGGSVR